MISGVKQSFRHVYVFDNLLIGSNSSLECLFNEQLNLKLNVKNCPISKHEFHSVFKSHSEFLRSDVSKMNSTQYLNKFRIIETFDLNNAMPIEDNFPKYEYYIFNNKNPAKSN